MDILMPQLGETVAEGKITTWFKSIGDAVKPGDNLFEIETDKVSMEVPATAAGVLTEIRVGAGEVAPVGAVVAIVAGAAGEPAAKAPVVANAPVAAKAPMTAAPPPDAATMPVFPAAAVTSATASARVMLDPFSEVRTPERNYGPARLTSGAVVTPLARRLAGEGGIDLSRVVASGPHGRIVARDVLSELDRIEALRDSFGQRRPMSAERPAPSPERIKALYAEGTYEDVPLDPIRRTTAARLVEARQTIPLFYLVADIAIERLQAVRREANAAALPDAAGAPTFKLSLNDFIIKGLALALQRVPVANAVWAEDRILRFKSSDIAVAVAIDRGLVTPVIRGAENKSLLAISGEMKDLAARARVGKLTPAEIQGGASTVSNLGMFGVREFAAIIDPPHATILAAGGATRRPVETADGGVAFTSQMTVTLSCDHRVVDGAVGAELLAAFRHFIEHPVAMMI
jgi:pyruvate dehydrogenase E2 component (dihydrolipoamide acetyltransferase)